MYDTGSDKALQSALPGLLCFGRNDVWKNGDLSIDEIEKQYDFLMDHGGPFNIQLSGGEPTMRGVGSGEIIHMGKRKGFTFFFQSDTNGIRHAQEAGYARKLKKAGLNTVFLQFDGVTDDACIRHCADAL